MAKKTEKQTSQSKYDQLINLFIECPKEEWNHFIRMIEARRPKTFNYKAPKNVGVGEYIRGLIKEGYTNRDILALVNLKYENNNTTYACVAWYRNDINKKSLATKVA